MVDLKLKNSLRYLLLVRGWISGNIAFPHQEHGYLWLQPPQGNGPLCALGADLVALSSSCSR